MITKPLFWSAYNPTIDSVLKSSSLRRRGFLEGQERGFAEGIEAGAELLNQTFGDLARELNVERPTFTDDPQTNAQRVVDFFNDMFGAGKDRIDKGISEFKDFVDIVDEKRKNIKKGFDKLGLHRKRYEKNNKDLTVIRLAKEYIQRDEFQSIQDSSNRRMNQIETEIDAKRFIMRTSGLHGNSAQMRIWKSEVQDLELELQDINQRFIAINSELESNFERIQDLEVDPRLSASDIERAEAIASEGIFFDPEQFGGRTDLEEVQEYIVDRIMDNEVKINTLSTKLDMVMSDDIFDQDLGDRLIVDVFDIPLTRSVADEFRDPPEDQDGDGVPDWELDTDDIDFGFSFFDSS